MRNIILGIVFFMLIVLSIVSVYAISDRDIRHNEAVNALDAAVEGTLNTLSKKTYSINNSDEFVADMVAALAEQIKSKSDLSIKILDQDFEKGLLSVEVTTTYKHINGKTGNVSVYKTVILEQKEELKAAQDKDTEMVTIEYYLPGDVLYKTYKVVKGQRLEAPVNPIEQDGKKFTGWTLNGVPYDFSSYLTADNDMKLVAVFK